MEGQLSSNTQLGCRPVIGLQQNTVGKLAEDATREHVVGAPEGSKCLAMTCRLSISCGSVKKVIITKTARLPMSSVVREIHLQILRVFRILFHPAT
jgi:hypothetical protein